MSEKTVEVGVTTPEVFNQVENDTDKCVKIKRGTITQIAGGTFLMLIGASILLKSFLKIPITNFISDLIWPALLIAIGFGLLIRSKRKFVGGLVLILGVLSLFSSLELIDFSFPLAFLGFVLVYVGIVLIAKFTKPKNDDEVVDLFWKIVKEED
jgi:hypothetical protein